MAKGKKKRPAVPTNPPTKTVADLMAVQVAELGHDLVRWNGNVYTILSARYGVTEPDEAIFDRLKAEGDAFKCELCDRWKLMAEKGHSAGGDSDICGECLTADDPDDDESDD